MDTLLVLTAVLGLVVAGSVVYRYVRAKSAQRVTPAEVPNQAGRHVDSQEPTYCNHWMIH